MSGSEDQRPAPRGGADRTVAVTCQIHGARGFCNLRLTKVGGAIVLDPHVPGSCVLTLDEKATRAVFEVFREWLGVTPGRGPAGCEP